MLKTVQACSTDSAGLNDATIGLPYWDWAADGALPPSGQVGSALWQNSGIGGTGRPVSNGPFQADVFRVRIESNAFAALRTTDRGLNRELGADPDAPTLPTPASEVDALGQSPYDIAPWSRASLGFRNRLEGWLPFGMHNQVHVWIGGDMGPATSPNDPVFYLNHCNVDRIWEAWLVKGSNLCAEPIRIGAASHAPAKRSHVFNPHKPTNHTSPNA